MINVGIIGAGRFASRHAQALTEIEGARLVAACRRDAAALEPFTRRFGIRGYTDYREMLQSSDIDAVSIATPHDQHTEMVIAAAQAGKHIFLEKPMAPSLEECDRIVEAADRAGVKLMVGHTFRFVAAFATAKTMLAGGEVGDIVMGAAAMLKSWDPAARRPWHLDRKLGGGVMLTAGMHSVDLLIWLMASRVRSISAVFATRFHDQPSDDSALLFLRFENGLAGIVATVGYVTGVTFMHPVHLICTKGMLLAGPGEGLRIGRAEQWQEVPGTTSPTWQQDAVLVEWRGFIEAIAQRRDPPVTGEDARHTMATIFAAEQSSATGKEVLVA